MKHTPNPLTPKEGKFNCEKCNGMAGNPVMCICHIPSPIITPTPLPQPSAPKTCNGKMITCARCFNSYCDGCFHDCPNCNTAVSDYLHSPKESWEFWECPECRGKSGSPVLCQSCLHNRDIIESIPKLFIEKSWEDDFYKLTKTMDGQFRPKLKLLIDSLLTEERERIVKELKKRKKGQKKGMIEELIALGNDILIDDLVAFIKGRNI